jgi:hypothetical protein
MDTLNQDGTVIDPGLSDPGGDPYGWWEVIGNTWHWITTPAPPT